MIKLNWIERKKPDWIVAQVINEAGATINDVSISKVSKKGEEFPNFETLAPGMSVEGVLWQSPAGKSYLFPPRPQTGGAYKASGAISKAQERKAESIEKSFDRKEGGIKVSATMRDAVQLTLAELGGNRDHTEYERRILYWRQWIWENWDATDADFSPFPKKPNYSPDENDLLKMAEEADIDYNEMEQH